MPENGNAQVPTETVPAGSWAGFRVELDSIKDSIRSLSSTVKDLAAARQLTPQNIIMVVGALGAFILLYTQPIGRNVDTLATTMEKQADRLSIILEKQADRHAEAVRLVNDRLTLAIEASRRDRAEETRYGRQERIDAIKDVRADYEAKISGVSDKIQTLWTQIVPRQEHDRSWTDRRLADEAVQRQIAEIQAQLRGFGNAGDMIRMTIADIKRIEEQIGYIRSWQAKIEPAKQ
jgi:hypothetical protein